MRRSSSWEGLSIESTPIDPTEAILTVIAGGDEAGKPFATAMATMASERSAVHEEGWAQLFIDGGFVDVVRVLEIDQGVGHEALRVARFRLPDLYLDGEAHRACVRFVRAVSRVVPRATGEEVMPKQETAEAAEAVSEFVARLAPRPRLRAAR